MAKDMQFSQEESKWKKEEIASRLGLSSILYYDRKLDAKTMAKWPEAGIFNMEVCGGWPSRSDHYDHRNWAQVKQIARDANEQGINIHSVHGPAPTDPCLGDYSSEIKEDRQKAIDGTLQAAEAALELGANILVMHLGTTNYSEECISEILKRFSNESLKFVNENGRELQDYMRMIDKINNRCFGMCIDVGHTRNADDINPIIQPGNAYPVIAQTEERLYHVHLHDFYDTDHFPPFMGYLQWNEVFAALKDIEYNGVFMFEPAGHEERRAGLSRDGVLEKVAKFPEEFVQQAQ